MKKTFYITTPIYYVNDKPHIGHAYTSIAADVLARHHRLLGDEVVFLTGTDENSQKNVEAAQKAGVADMKEYLDTQASIWKKTWEDLGITYTDFIRTTEERHKKSVYAFFEKVHAKGDIYKGSYKGYYCVACEAFVTESDLLEGKLCPIHKKPVDFIEEENYFFAASRYRDQVLAYIEANPDSVQPASRRHEVVNYIKDHFQDVSISRQGGSWGIPLPIDETHVIYVWFDALVNYLTAVGYGQDDVRFEKFWPVDLHLVGKDIIKFHCALWPAMLLSAGLPLPKKVFAHGFFTIDGEKISKSLGNTIDPVALAQRGGVDALRYFLLREIRFGEDGDFSFQRYEERYVSDLSKGIGNTVSRIAALAQKVPVDDLRGDIDAEMGAPIREAFQTAQATMWAAFENCAFDRALESLWMAITEMDRYIEKHKPWELAKNDPAQFVVVMRPLCEGISALGLLVRPFMPSTAAKIDGMLGLVREQYPEQCYGAIFAGTVVKGDALFPPLEVKGEDAL